MILIQKSQEHLKTDHSDVDHGISGIVVPLSFTPDSRYTSPDTWRAHDEHMNALMSWKGPKTSTSPCELLNMAFLSSYFFLHAWNCVWHLLCRQCACSCKINSCIFKKDANESAPWTGLLAWNLITSVLPFANEFTFPFCLFSFSLLDRCYEFQIWHDGLSRNKMPNSCFIQQSDFCFKRKVRQRQKEKKTQKSLVCLLLLIFAHSQTDGFLCRWCDSPWLRDGRMCCQLPLSLVLGDLVSLLCSLLRSNQS